MVGGRGSGVTLAREIVEFARTVRLAHTVFALPFALGMAFLAEPPVPGAAALALVLACMVTARTAAMGMNRVADARLDAANPRTADRAIPAGRLRRGTALALALASGGAFVAAAWGFGPLRGNPWPGLLAPAFLAVLYGYSWTKRVTVLAHAVLGLALGLAPVGVWVALRGEIAAGPVLVGAGVLAWTAGFDVLYALQDTEIDRARGLRSLPARLGPGRARVAAALGHVAALGLLAAGAWAMRGRTGLGSAAALAAMAGLLAIQHARARRADPARIARDLLPANAAVSLTWMAGAILDAACGL